MPEMRFRPRGALPERGEAIPNFPSPRTRSSLCMQYGIVLGVADYRRGRAKKNGVVCLRPFYLLALRRGLRARPEIPPTEQHIPRPTSRSSKHASKLYRCTVLKKNSSRPKKKWSCRNIFLYARVRVIPPVGSKKPINFHQRSGVENSRLSLFRTSAFRVPCNVYTHTRYVCVCVRCYFSPATIAHDRW